MAAGPVADEGVLGEHRQQLARNLGRGEQIVELQAHAGNLVVEPIEFLRVIEVDEREPGVVLEHADLEDAERR